MKIFVKIFLQTLKVHAILSCSKIYIDNIFLFRYTWTVTK